MELTMIILGLLLVLLAVVGILYLGRMRRANGGEVPEEQPCHQQEHICSGCCGGTGCFNAKLRSKPHIVYFEDEELDRFRRRSGDDYTEREVQEWREVLATLQPEEVGAWARSIQLRCLPIPRSIREELEHRHAIVSHPA